MLDAYRLARDRTSIMELASLLPELDYVYPYHQAIGFSLELAGHSRRALAPFRGLPREFDFYLTHHKGTFTYVKDWQLYVPDDLALGATHGDGHLER